MCEGAGEVGWLCAASHTHSALLCHGIFWFAGKCMWVLVLHAHPLPLLLRINWMYKGSSACGELCQHLRQGPHGAAPCSKLKT